MRQIYPFRSLALRGTVLFVRTTQLHPLGSYRLRSALFTLIALPCLLLTGCITSMAPGSMDSIKPTSTAARAGNVYLIRGWGGMFSWGIDELAHQLETDGISAHVFQHDQCDEMARTLVEKYRNVRNPEPLCIVAHSAGSDDALYIAGELKKAGIDVDLLITLDNVDATIVPGNVKVCYNYWLPGTFGESNFLRGLPMEKQAGSKGQVVNINLAEDGSNLCEPNPSHVSLDKDLKLRPHIVEKVLAACPQRATWAATNASPPANLAAGLNQR